MNNVTYMIIHWPFQNVIESPTPLEKELGRCFQITHERSTFCRLAVFFFFWVQVRVNQKVVGKGKLLLLTDAYPSFIDITYQISIIENWNLWRTIKKVEYIIKYLQPRIYSCDSQKKRIYSCNTFLVSLYTLWEYHLKSHLVFFSFFPFLPTDWLVLVMIIFLKK